MKNQAWGLGVMAVVNEMIRAKIFESQPTVVSIHSLANPAQMHPLT